MTHDMAAGANPRARSTATSTARVRRAGGRCNFNHYSKCNVNGARPAVRNGRYKFKNKGNSEKPARRRRYVRRSRQRMR
jgi:hypothetical protein